VPASVAVVTGASGNLGRVLVTECAKQFDFVIAFDRREDADAASSNFVTENTLWCLGSECDNLRDGIITMVLTSRLSLIPNWKSLYFFHAAAEVRTAGELKLQEVLQNNTLLTLNLFNEVTKWCDDWNVRLRFIVFDTVGRTLITRNSTNYSASKAAQHICALEMQSRSLALEKTSVLILYLGFDDSVTNDHLNVRFLKISTIKMVRKVVEAALGDKSRVSVPCVRNALIGTIGRAMRLLPPKKRNRFESYLLGLFRV